MYSYIPYTQGAGELPPIVGEVSIDINCLYAL